METILILDDNKASSAVLKMALMRKGYRVGRTMDLQYVINHAWSGQFDLLLVSHAFGRACGWEVFNHLAEVVPHLPAMVYAMAASDLAAAAAIVEAVDAAVYETRYVDGRCLEAATLYGEAPPRLRVVNTRGERD